MANRRSSDARGAGKTTPISGRPSRAARPRGSATTPLSAALTPEVRHAMIAEKAYLRAERRGFAPGREAEDWLAAEAEVDAMLDLSHRGSSQ